MKSVLKGIFFLVLIAASSSVYSQSSIQANPGHETQATKGASETQTQKYDPNMNYDDFGNVIGPKKARTQDTATPGIDNDGPVDDFGNPITVERPARSSKEDAPVKFKDTDGVDPNQNPDQ